MRKEILRNVALMSMGVTAAGIVGGLIANGSDGVSDALYSFHKPSAVERTVDIFALHKYGKVVITRCTSMAKSGEDLGETRFGVFTPIDTIRLTEGTCKELGRIMTHPQQIDTKDRAAGTAIHTVAHEVSHAVGSGNGIEEGNEGITQCFAAQRATQFAAVLGLSASQAEAMGDISAQMASAPPTPEYTVPRGCNSGGEYDLHLEGAHYPYNPVDKYIKDGVLGN